MQLDPRVLKFVNKEKISVLTTLLEDGTPHSATMHFATSSKSLEFVFFTKEKSRKCSALRLGEKSKASLTIGFSEKEWKELQMEGEIERIDKTKSKKEEEIFASKFEGAELDSEHIVLRFIPTWWRYTQFKPKPPLIITSESK